MAAVKKATTNKSVSGPKIKPAAGPKAKPKTKTKTKVKVLKVNIQPTKRIVDAGKGVVKKETVIAETKPAASSSPTVPVVLPAQEKIAVGAPVRILSEESREEQKKEVEKTIEKEQAKMAPAEKNRVAAPGSDAKPLNLYRKIAFSFIFLTLALLAVIFYFSFVKVSIILIPGEERVANNLIVDIYDQDKNQNLGADAVSGAVEKVEAEETKTYSASGTQIIGEEAVGRAVIVNNYNKNQPLVATTRLLSSDGKLFRTKETVNAPAGGTVEVDIYADKPSSEMAIGPTRFTIPGLWAGLQDKIYAENRKPIRYQKQVKKYIVQTDIDAAVIDLKQALLVKAKNEINEKYKEYDQVIYNIDENSLTTSATGKVGEEKENFSVTAKTSVVVVAFLGETVAAQATNKFISTLSDGKELLEFNKENIVYSLSNFNVEQGVATVNASFEGKIALSGDASIIDREKLVGLTREQIAAYLSGFPEIAGYEINFSPSFIKKAPNLVDKISVEIKK